MVYKLFIEEGLYQDKDTKEQRNHHQEAPMKIYHHVILHLSLSEVKAQVKLIH